ncbi:MAG: 30S ribosomal protein S7 [Spirochaetales bacterium]|nr:30S ribosomal protein S7 [Spirochaetales bacterium]
MSRKRSATVRKVEPDPVYKSESVTRFVNRLMLDGKKSISFKVFYGALDKMKAKGQEDPFDAFKKAIDNVKPQVEVKSRRVGGATYQVPVEVGERRKETLAYRWIINASRARVGKSMSDKLAAELLDALNSTGASVKKKEDVYKMAEANKAFSHFKF